MWNKIKNTDSRIILMAGIVILFLLLLQQCGARKNAEIDLAMANNNIHALNDTIEQTKNKLGDVQYEKSVLITSEKGLKSLNAELATEVDAQKGKVAQLTKIIAILSTPHVGPVTGTGTVQGNPCDSLGTYIAEWKSLQQFDANNFRNLSAKTSLKVQKGVVLGSTTDILTDELGFDIITGLEEQKDGHYEIFVRSNYPGFKPTKIDGAFIPRDKLFPPQKQKRWSVGAGLQAGVGIGGLVKAGPVWYVGVGLGIQYTFFRF